MSQCSDSSVESDDMSMKEKERLTAVAKAMTEDLLTATDLLGKVDWGLVHEKHGISLFRADVNNDVPCNVHAVCKFSSDIEDVAESMITSTTDSYKHMMSMLSSDFIDGSVVQTIVEPTELNPHRHVALKWAAFKSSSRFGKDRDFIILEYVDMIEDDQGQKIAFRIMESVDMPNNSPFAESPKYTRDIVPLMGFMYHTTKKQGELRLTYSCNFDKNGELPAWVANSAIQQHVEKCMMGIIKYIEAFRTDKKEIVLPQQVIPMSEQDHCHLCKKNFCVLRRKHNCLKCGEVICSNCSKLRTATVPDVGERQLRVCTACFIAARRPSKTPAPPEGGLVINCSGSSTTGSSSPGSRAPSTVTIDSDVTSVRCGGSNHSNSTNASSLGRTQSFCICKRRSLDDVLDPVRSRLIEYKTFSDAAESLPIPKASYPVRSFSDGIIRRVPFTSSRRGSPADLAISIEAFRQHQVRMGATDQQQDDGDVSSHSSESEDEDVMDQLQYYSTSSVGYPSSESSVGSPPSVATVEPFAQLSSSERQRQRNRSGASASQSSRRPTVRITHERNSPVYAPHRASENESRARFKEAAERAPDLIDMAMSTHHLAQHVRRKASHHRVAAIQMEHMGNQSQPLPPQQQHQHQLLNAHPNVAEVIEYADVGIIPPARGVRRAVCQTRHGAVLYGRNPANPATEAAVDQQIQLMVRGIADVSSSNQCVDASYRRQQVYPSEPRPVHASSGSGRYY